MKWLEEIPVENFVDNVDNLVYKSKVPEKRIFSMWTIIVDKIVDNVDE